MLKFTDVTYHYGDGREALHNVFLEAISGEVLLIVGHNGAGKSTFLKLSNGILKPTGGRIVVNGKDSRTETATELAKEIAVTFQNPRDQIFASTVEQEISFGPRILNRKNAQDLAQHAIALFGFAQERQRHPYDLPLSRQKLLTTACAIASGSPILAFDEPSSGLSLPERKTLINGLLEAKENRLLIIISHDFDLFLPFASRVLILNHGTLVRETTAENLIRKEALLRRETLKLPLSLRLYNLLEDIG